MSCQSQMGLILSLNSRIEDAASNPDIGAG